MAEAPPTEQDDVKTTVEALKQRNRDLERRLTELESKIGASAEQQQMRREEIKMLIDQTLAENKKLFSPDWMENLKFGGDLRLRYEYRHRTNDVANGDNDERGRFRLRFGFEKAWPQEDLMVGFRLATGADTDPTSTNQTFGNMFQEYSIGVDRAYARWTPKAVKGLSITAGKMPNPWEATNLVWDTDVNPEGAWVEYRAAGLGKFEPFVGAGMFELFSSSRRPDANLTAYQAGLRYQITPTVKWTTAAQGFIYTNIDSAFANVVFFGANPRGNTVRGGRLAAGRFSEFDFVNRVDFVACNRPWTVFTDWVHNTNNEFTSGQSDGFAVGLKVGQNKKKGDWSARYIWKRLEADATLAFFADSDFGWNTFTNRKGHEWGLEYSLTDALTAGLTLFYTQPIAAPNSEHFLTIQADLVWKF
jgi:hypothetical protein